MNTDVARLKEEGNALFVEKNFAAAHKKYTEAIALDDRNAVLYANRSACSTGMKKFLDAVRDADKATKIDPGYAKGWSRGAVAHEAIDDWYRAVHRWTKALEAINSKGDLSPAEVKQKEQYTEMLEKAKRRLESPPRPVIIIDETVKMPWQVAEEMLPQLSAAGQGKSSAWMVYYANREFMGGVKAMKQLGAMTDSMGEPARIAHTGVIASLSNGLMSDIRVLRFDCPDWMDKYNRQLVFEMDLCQAWVSEGVDDIQRSALERVKKDGWSAVRPALAIVVRRWVMRAIFDHHSKGVAHAAVERLKQTLELLQWGRRVWKDVSSHDRGVIFEDSFVRGVKVKYLQALMEAHLSAIGDDQNILLETLFAAASELHEETHNLAPPGSLDQNEFVARGFFLAYYVCPFSDACAMLGYYHMQMVGFTGNHDEENLHYRLAHEYYAKAAYALPVDDENHSFFLSCCIAPMVMSDAPEHMVMDIVRAIRTSMPQMQRIWAHSTFAKRGRDAMIETSLRIAEQRFERIE